MSFCKCVVEGFITTSTPHSNNVFNLTPSHETTPPRSSKTPGATPTHVATPTHKTTPTHSATPTHRATPTQGVTRQAWSDVGRGHVLDVNQNNVSQDAHSDPVVTTLFTGEHPGRVTPHLPTVHFIYHRNFMCSHLGMGLSP